MSVSCPLMSLISYHVSLLWQHLIRISSHLIIRSETSSHEHLTMICASPDKQISPIGLLLTHEIGGFLIGL